MPAVPRNSNSFVYRSRLCSSGAAIFVVAIGILVLIGWQFDVTRLKSIYGDITTEVLATVAGLQLRENPSEPPMCSRNGCWRY